jgi:hypothetical protein
LETNDRYGVDRSSGSDRNKKFRNQGEAFHPMGLTRHSGNRRGHSRELRPACVANVLRVPVRLTRIGPAAAAFARALAAFHAALFVPDNFCRAVNVRRAHGEQQEQRQEVLGDCPGGHVQETRHERDFLHV